MSQPPLDGSILLHDLGDFHLEHNPTTEQWAYAEDGVGPVKAITFLESTRAIHRAAVTFRSLPLVPGPVAVFALLDIPTYATLFLGLMKAGYVVRTL
jgi:acyl-coenzyme A synthetase/AMP-(fatty) acid ligase